MVGAALNTIASGVLHLYPMRAAQGQMPPFGTYNIVTVTPVKTIGGKNKVFEYDLQVNIYGTTYDAVDTLAQSFITTIDRYSNTNVKSENVKDIRHEGGPEDLYQDDADLYGKAIDIKMWIIHN